MSTAGNDPDESVQTSVSMNGDARERLGSRSFEGQEASQSRCGEQSFDLEAIDHQNPDNSQFVRSEDDSALDRMISKYLAQEGCHPEFSLSIASQQVPAPSEHEPEPTRNHTNTGTEGVPTDVQPLEARRPLKLAMTTPADTPLPSRNESKIKELLPEKLKRVKACSFRKGLLNGLLAIQSALRHCAPDMPKKSTRTTNPLPRRLSGVPPTRKKSAKSNKTINLGKNEKNRVAKKNRDQRIDKFRGELGAISEEASATLEDIRQVEEVVSEFLPLCQTCQVKEPEWTTTTSDSTNNDSPATHDKTIVVEINYHLHMENQGLWGKLLVLVWALSLLGFAGPGVHRDFKMESLAQTPDSDAESGHQAISNEAARQRKCRKEMAQLVVENAGLRKQNNVLQALIDQMLQFLRDLLKKKSTHGGSTANGDNSDDGETPGGDDVDDGCSGRRDGGRVPQHQATGGRKAKQARAMSDEVIAQAMTWLMAMEVVVDVKQALVDAYRRSLSVAADVPGDIPTLLRHVYSRHVGGVMPSVQKPEVIEATPADLDELSAMLDAIPELKPEAQTLLDRARSILTDGPSLSKNAELVDGEDLPVALHTLLQGTLWSILMQAGADPDLARSAEDAVAQQVAYTAADKLLWFLCRKFLFTHHVAAKDGLFSQESSWNFYAAHVLYVGRLFKLAPVPTHGPQLTRKLRRVVMPPIVALYTNTSKSSFIGVTPSGLWTWGANEQNQLGIASHGEPVHPARVSFTACRDLAEYESTLPAWRKARLVDKVWMLPERTFILTPVGMIMAGYDRRWYIGPNRHHATFKPVPLPAGFSVAHLMDTEDMTVITSQDARQVISGSNGSGELGLGHQRTMTLFAELPFWVDKIVVRSSQFAVFLSDSRLLFAGRVPTPIAQSGLLDMSEGTVCSTATLLHLPPGVKAFVCTATCVAWVVANKTFCWTRKHCLQGVPFESTLVAQGRFCDKDGQWHRVCVSDDGASLELCDAASVSVELMPLF
ncbi:hypothetical protein J8273_1318 [Carpediemonas membranifera]|uniref:Uncharacterized protein n=1 Tax=Carpediemonas membranifera TaxID=201153 RepID=A0A8J6EBE3_9EUKA|nr:hypothetical protein J8273_1318 [Carpediemonas membranifera]|eukprot:KAG9396970.1 hypothetical protein J8273_1318 [Carpediemonas membranifera]